MGLVTVQEYRHANHGDMGHGQRKEHDLPPGKAQSTVAQPLDYGPEHGLIGKLHINIRPSLNNCLRMVTRQGCPSTINFARVYSYFFQKWLKNINSL
jgi:hypothetical protein